MDSGGLSVMTSLIGMMLMWRVGSLAGRVHLTTQLAHMLGKFSCVYPQRFLLQATRANSVQWSI